VLALPNPHPLMSFKSAELMSFYTDAHTRRATHPWFRQGHPRGCPYK